MTFTTDVLLYVGHSGDKGLQPFLDALMENDDRYHATLLPLDTDAANGPRSFGGSVLAQGGNHFPTWDMQRLLDSVHWSFPGDVVLICATEDRITQVFRPNFEVEQEWGSHARAVQVAPRQEADDADEPDDTLWQIAPPNPRVTVDELMATLAAEIFPTLHLRRIRWLLSDGGVSIFVPAEYFPEWMDPDWRPQLALMGARRTEP